MRLNGKVAIITGAANGIGRDAAILFGQEGAKVVVVDRDQAAGDGTAALIETGLFVQADISREEDVARVVNAAIDRFGGMDILVNNAGVAIGGTVVDTSPDRWDRLMAVNLSGVYLACRAAIPHMIERGGGSVVSVASVQGMFGFPHWAAYAASKHAIIGMTRQMVVDFAEHGIRFNSVSPGAIDTTLSENIVKLEPEFAKDPTPIPDEAVGLKSQRIPALRRPGKPEDVARVILFLASDESRHVNGQNIVVDGGASCWLA